MNKHTHQKRNRAVGSGLSYKWAIEYAGKLERRTYEGPDCIDHTNTQLALIALSERGNENAFCRIIDRYFEVLRATDAGNDYEFLAKLCKGADELAHIEDPAVGSMQLFARLYPKPS